MALVCNGVRVTANLVLPQLSDTLLSILATRGGEVVESIFGRLETTMNGVSHANGTSNHHDA